MSASSRWIYGPRFLVPGEERDDLRALEIDGAGAITGWAPRVPPSWTGRKEEIPGAFAMAGLHDAHLHLDWLGARTDEVDLAGVRDLPALRSLLEAELRARVEPDVLVGRALDLDTFLERGDAHWRGLDGLSSRPIVLRGRDGHALWLNRAAMAATPDAWPSIDPDGGRVERDAQGEPTGVLVDRAMEPVFRLYAVPDAKTLERRIARAVAQCAQAGLTSVHSMALPPEAVPILKRLDAQGELPVRVFAYLDGTREESWRLLDVEEAMGPRFHLAGIKLFADGALGSRGAAMLADYDDAPGCSGHLHYPPDELGALARRAHERGIQLAIHAIGDHGNRVVLDVLSRLPHVNSARHRIEHAQIVEPSDRSRFASLGVVASMQPCHASSDAPWVEERLGAQRLAHAYPWALLAAEGVTLAFGTDAPIEALEPGPAMASALARSIVGDSLSLTAVLMARTLGASTASRSERWLGRVAPGHRADLTLVEAWPETPEQWRHLQVSGSVVGGRLADSA